MTKKARRIDNPKQLSLLDYLQQQARPSIPQPGTLHVQNTIKALLSRALKETSRSRYEVAARMSELLGQEITKAMLDAWTAESKEYHRFPAEFIPAFCEAAGNRDLLTFLAEKTGAFCLPGPDALRAEVKRIEEQIEGLHQERRKRLLFLKEMGGERSASGVRRSATEGEEP
jgi:hypothetical protein